MNLRTLFKNRVVNKKRLLISLCSFIVLISTIIATFFSHKILTYDKIYKGVFINKIDCSNLPLSTLKNSLASTYIKNFQDARITLVSDTSSRIIPFSEINVQFDIDDTANNAYAVGRNGNLFKRIFEISSVGRKQKILNVSFKYDHTKLNQIIDEENKKISNNLNEPRLKITDEKVSLISGQTCKVVDKTKVLELIKNAIASGDSAYIILPLKTVSPSKLDADTLLKQINTDPKNASFALKNNTVKIFPHIVGRKISKAQLEQIIKELSGTENVEKVLPVEFTPPKINSTLAAANLFKNTLGSYSTIFYTSNQNDKNRGVNIRLAVNAINEKILLPGEIFSFNNVVGERTDSNGYKAAHTYVSGKVVDSIGGGICQVSTTLYNAVLLSKLSVVERSNHMFTVGYVPFGMDASVSYGSVDFKFKNNTNWPIKISGYVTKDNKIIFSLIGTDEEPHKVYQYKNVKVKTTPYSTKYIDDPSLESGKTEVLTEGMTGYVIDTYRIIKENGNVVKEQKIYTSVYKPLQREVRRGVKKVSPATVIIEPQTPIPASPGVDDADNPPAATSTSVPIN